MFIGNKYYYICFSIPSIFMVLMDISYTLWTLRKPISISYPTCLFAQNCHFYLPHVGCFSCPVPSLCMIHPALWRLKPVTYIVNVKCRLCTCHSYCNARNLWHLCRCVILKRCLGIMYVQVSWLVQCQLWMGAVCCCTAKIYLRLRVYAPPTFTKISSKCLHSFF